MRFSAILWSAFDQDSLCETGAEADIVVSMTGPSPIPGIGGTGGSCSTDQRLSQEDCWKTKQPYMMMEIIGKPQENYRKMVV